MGQDPPGTHGSPRAPALGGWGSPTPAPSLCSPRHPQPHVHLRGASALPSDPHPRAPHPRDTVPMCGAVPSAVLPPLCQKRAGAAPVPGAPSTAPSRGWHEGGAAPRPASLTRSCVTPGVLYAAFPPFSPVQPQNEGSPPAPSHPRAPQMGTATRGPLGAAGEEGTPHKGCRWRGLWGGKSIRGCPEHMPAAPSCPARGCIGSKWLPGRWTWRGAAAAGGRAGS